MSEKAIIEVINSKYPDHGILGEEGGIKNDGSEYLWIIDPLDGTVNYAHGFPFFSVSAALSIRKEVVLGVVYSVVLNELFTAVKGKGAFLNGKKIKVSGVKRLDAAFISTGFPYSIHEKPGSQFKHFEKICRKCQAVRRAGSAALDLCYVASGIFDGFWEKDLHPWDTAAGKLMIEEAGGKVTDYQGKKFDIFNNEIACSNGIVHKEFIKLLK
jgi:myo-inositol-1(or 4)-monophosphatase